MSRYSERQSGAGVGARLRMEYRAGMVRTGFSTEAWPHNWRILEVATVQLFNRENKNYLLFLEMMCKNKYIWTSSESNGKNSFWRH